MPRHERKSLLSFDERTPKNSSKIPQLNIFFVATCLTLHAIKASKNNAWGVKRRKNFTRKSFRKSDGIKHSKKFVLPIFFVSNNHLRNIMLLGNSIFMFSVYVDSIIIKSSKNMSIPAIVLSTHNITLRNVWVMETGG